MVMCNNNNNNILNTIQNGQFILIYGIFIINICLNLDIYNNKIPGYENYYINNKHLLSIERGIMIFIFI